MSDYRELAASTVRYQLANVIRASLGAKAMTTRQWADVIRYVTGESTPVMSMREGVAQKVLDFYEIVSRPRGSLN